jgi:hypothetical protein
MENKKLLINCSCDGDEILKFLSFEQEPFGNKEDREIYINFVGDHRISGIDKLKTIWSILKTGEFENYGILADKNEIKNIINYLQDTLDYWETLDQKPYCQHEMISIETNPFTRYGVKSAYISCKKCGLDLSQAQKQCNHEADCFGVCRYCNTRIGNFNCKHQNWCKEPWTEDEYCEICGEWKDNINN